MPRISVRLTQCSVKRVCYTLSRSRCCCYKISRGYIKTDYTAETLKSVVLCQYRHSASLQYTIPSLQYLVNIGTPHISSSMLLGLLCAMYTVTVHMSHTDQRYRMYNVDG